MRDKKLQEILALARALSARQRKTLPRHLAAMDKASEAIAVIDPHQQGQPICPYRGQSHVVRNGHCNDLQPYLCRGWLTGVAEADQSYSRRSAKGQRRALLLKARKPAGQPSQRSSSQELVPVLVARDHGGPER